MQQKKKKEKKKTDKNKRQTDRQNKGRQTDGRTDGRVWLYFRVLTRLILGVDLL